MRRKLLNGVRFCKCCGARMLFQGYDTQNRFGHIMDKECICYDCAYWKDIIAYPPDNLEVVGDICMRIFPKADKKDKSIILGSKGKLRYFMRLDMSLFSSNDVWVIGKIPEHLRFEFKTTAVEITKKMFMALSSFGKQCKARACLDRYHCVRYNLKLENDMGAYNSIPTNWVVGGEHCGTFLNKGEILTDENSVIK